MNETDAEVRDRDIPTNGAEASTSPPAPEADNEQAQERSARPAALQKPLWRRLTALGLSFAAGVGATEARHQVFDSSPADRPPGAVAEPAPDYQENTLPGAPLTEAQARQQEAIRVADAERVGGNVKEAIKTFSEVHGLKEGPNIILDSKLVLKFISDGELFPNQDQEAFKKTLNQYLEGYFEAVRSQPDSPLKTELLDAYEAAKKNGLSGYELIVALPTNPHTHWQPPEVSPPQGSDPESPEFQGYLKSAVENVFTPIPDGTPSDSPELTRMQAGLIYEEGRRTVIGINLGAVEGSDVVRRVVNGETYDLSIHDAVVANLLHEIGHKLLESQGETREGNLGEIEAVLEGADAAFLKALKANPNSYPQLLSLTR